MNTSFKRDVIPEYDADILGTPFKVILRKGVRVEVCDTCGAIVNTAIPDPEGLLYAVSFARALHPRKLTGAEIKFLRNVICWKSKKLAEELGISPEHMSRIENGKLPMAAPSERLFRLYCILQPGAASNGKEAEAQAKVQAIFRDAVDDLFEGMKHFKIETTWNADDPLIFSFERRQTFEIDGFTSKADNGKWRFEKKLKAA